MTPGTLINGITGASEPITFETGNMNDRRLCPKTHKYFVYKVYKYGHVIMSTTSNLAKLLLKKKINRYPVVVISETGEGHPGWVCSLGYKYKKVARMKINVRFLDPLKYCEHLEIIREKLHGKKETTKKRLSA